MSALTPHAEAGVLPNPLDTSYSTLDCDLTPVDLNSKEGKLIVEYTKNTTGGWRTCHIQEIFAVNRHSEGKRFAAHDKKGNRKLLWHGTNVAVVAAILKTGASLLLPLCVSLCSSPLQACASCPTREAAWDEAFTAPARTPSSPATWAAPA